MDGFQIGTSEYLKRCKAYSCNLTLQIHGCNHSASPVGNNVGNAMSNNPSVLYSLMRQESIVGQSTS